MQCYGFEYKKITKPRSLDVAYNVKGGHDHINMKYDDNYGERPRFSKVDEGIIHHSSNSNLLLENLVLRYQ